MIDVGVADVGDNLSYLRVGKVLAADKHPNADKLQLCSARRRRERAAADRLRSVELRSGGDRRGRSPGCSLAGVPCPARRAAAAGRGVARDDPRRGRDRPRLRPRRDHDPARRHRARDAARGRPARARTGARRHPDDEPRRPAVDGRPRPRGGDALRRRADPDLGRRPGDRASRVGRRLDRRSRRLPALHRPRVQGCHRRLVADVAPRPPARGRDAVDLERRRRHQLRHARLREPSARLRPREARRRAHRRAARRGRRGVAHARRDAADARRARSADHRRNEGGGALAAIMGGAESEVALRHDRGAARGRQLRADRDSAHVGAARPPDGGVEPVGEGRRSSSRRIGGGARQSPARRSCGRRADRERRRALRPARAPGCPAPPRAHGSPGRARRRAGRAALDPEQPRFRGGRRLERDGADLEGARRRARDRRDRGGGTCRPAARASDDASAACRRRASDEGAAAAPRARGRARGSGLLGGLHVEPRRPGPRTRQRSASRTR